MDKNNKWATLTAEITKKLKLAVGASVNYGHISSCLSIYVRKT